jgi:hypothetical protein
MKLKREPRPELSREQAQLLAAVYMAFEEGMESCARLTQRREAGEPAAELRDEALEVARTIAYVSRAAFESVVHRKLLESIPDESRSPVKPLRVLSRLGYALSALAEDDPEPDALLSPEEVDGLVAKHGIEDWVNYNREMIARVEARTHE